MSAHDNAGSSQDFGYDWQHHGRALPRVSQSREVLGLVLTMMERREVVLVETAEDLAEQAMAQIAQRPGFREHLQEIHFLYNAFPRPWCSGDFAEERAHPLFRSEADLLLEAYHLAAAATC